jgi:hypothetical protein
MNGSIVLKNLPVFSRITDKIRPLGLILSSISAVIAVESLLKVLLILKIGQYQSLSHNYTIWLESTNSG